MIQVVEYDPIWPTRFGELRAEYARSLATAQVPVFAIEHVGSTSVPGLAAKPVIDIDIVVGPDDVAGASGALIGLGFEAMGEQGIPHRWAFREPERLARTNTYVVVDGCLALRNHLAVREILRSDHVLRDQYADAKRRVAAVAHDGDEYVRGKNDVMQVILLAAGFTDIERLAIAELNS